MDVDAQYEHSTYNKENFCLRLFVNSILSKYTIYLDLCESRL